MSNFNAEMHQIRFPPAGGAYDAPPGPLVGWEGDTPPHSPSPRRLWSLGLGAFGVEISLSPALLFQ